MKQEMVDYKFTINGLEVMAEYTQTSIQDIFIPLVRCLSEMQTLKGQRFIVYLVAPPAVGKSTLAQLFHQLSLESEELQEIQVVGLDGFHYPNSYLRDHVVLIDGIAVSMNDVKGCPETFDINKITETIQRMKTETVSWPRYDRIIHDVIDDCQLVDKSVVLIEGNWLLLSEKRWADLRELCDYSIFITAQERTLKERLIQRKVRGGLSRKQAEQFYERSDKQNIERVLSDSSSADLELELLGDGSYVKKEVHDS